MEFSGSITSEIIERILSGDLPPEAVDDGSTSRVWFADRMSGGGLNGVLLLRATRLGVDLVVPDGFTVADEYVYVNGSRYAVVYHTRLSPRIPIEATIAAVGTGISRLSSASELAVGDLEQRMKGDRSDFGLFFAQPHRTSGYIHATCTTDGMVSCLARNRYDPTKPIWQQRRVIVRPGRFFRGVDPSLSDSDVERLTNQWNALFVGTPAEFKLVDGPEIKTYYRDRAYAPEHETGTMGSSCMRYRRCESYLTIYSQNRQVVKLLVLEKPDGKIIGRALVWKTADGITFMDRVYGTEVTQRRFIDYAMAQGWWSRWRQSYQSSTSLRKPDGQNVFEHMQVTLNTRRVRRWPFMDTFAHVYDGSLANFHGESCLGYAQETDGGVEIINMLRCRGCGHYGGTLFAPTNAELCDRCVADGVRLCGECGSLVRTGDCGHCALLARNRMPADYVYRDGRYIRSDGEVLSGHALRYVGYTQYGADVYYALDTALVACEDGLRYPMDDERIPPLTNYDQPSRIESGSVAQEESPWG